MTKPKERSIMFTADMVNAIRHSRKTQTRRKITHLRGQVKAVKWWSRDATILQGVQQAMAERLNPIFYTEHCPYNPYGDPGDLLWVKETYRLHTKLEKYIQFRADNSAWALTPYGGLAPVPVSSGFEAKWRPSLYMPKWATRIWLQIDKVRVQQLQNIKAAECRAEGLTPETPTTTDTTFEFPQQFGRLWDSINNKDGYRWTDNPYVWVIEFHWLIAGKRATVPATVE